MSFTYLRALPTPEEIKQQYPLSAKLAAIKAERDNPVSYTHLDVYKRQLLIQ